MSTELTVVHTPVSAVAEADVQALLIHRIETAVVIEVRNRNLLTAQEFSSPGPSICRRNANAARGKTVRIRQHRH